VLIPKPSLFTTCRALSASSSTSRINFLHILLKTLPQTTQVGESAAEYFSLFHQLLQPLDYKMHLVSNGFLKQIFQLITEEVTRISVLDAHDIYAEEDLSQGYVLKEFVRILTSLISVPLLRSKVKQQKLLGVALDNYLALRPLVSQKSKVCFALPQPFFSFLFFTFLFFSFFVSLGYLSRCSSQNFFCLNNKNTNKVWTQFRWAELPQTC